MRGGKRRRWYEDLEPGDKLPVDYAFAQNAVGSIYRWTSDSYQWVPAKVIYDRYVAAWKVRLAPYPGDPDPLLLTLKQFGIALRIIFPDGTPTKRVHEKKRVRGLANLEGPGGLRSPDEVEAWRLRVKRPVRIAKGAAGTQGSSSPNHAPGAAGSGQ